MEKVTEFYFRYNVEKYYKLREGINAVFPNLETKDPKVRDYLTAIECLEHQLKHYIMLEYCVEEN